MTDQYFDDEELSEDDEELSELVRQTIAEELAKRARAEKPEGFFEGKAHEWLNPEVIDQDEEEPETAEDQSSRWIEQDKEPERNAFGAVIETPDEVWNAVREASSRIYGEQQEMQEKQRGIENWLREVEEEIARNKRANGK